MGAEVVLPSLPCRPYDSVPLRVGHGAAGFLAYGSSDEGANGPAEGDDKISYALGASFRAES
jgi:hypothetical protein